MLPRQRWFRQNTLPPWIVLQVIDVLMELLRKVRLLNAFEADVVSDVRAEVTSVANGVLHRRRLERAFANSSVSASFEFVAFQMTSGRMSNSVDRCLLIVQPLLILEGHV